MAAIAPLDVEWLTEVGDPVAVLGRTGALEWSNAAFRAVFRHAILPSLPPWGRVTPPPYKDGARRFEAGAPDGRRLEWSQSLLKDGRSVAIARDITERIAAAEDAARAKTTLFATLTHELRTPLNGVLGMAGLLDRTALDAAQRDYVRAIRHSGEHLLDLITEILDYSRLETGRLALESIVFSPEELVQGVVELMAPKAREKGLEIVATIDPDTPASVRGDDGRIRQILFNLVGNAVKFTEDGGVTVSVRRFGRGLRLSVKDTGPGIPAGRQAQIFEDFTQADASISRRYGGAGLGLAIVRRLAMAMDGSVSLDSQPGAGAIFSVDLNLEDVAGRGEGDGLAGALAGKTFAVLAANPVLRAGAARMVESLGGAGRPAASLRGLSADTDGALVDFGLFAELPDAEIAAWAAQSLAAVALIAPEDRGHIERLRRLGVHRYLIKPLRRRSVAEQLRPDAANRAQQSTPASTDDRAGQSQRLAGARVLLAEDNPVNALLARTVLSRAGAAVDVAADGEEAVAAFAREGSGYDLVLLDLRMPRLDGLGAARRLRNLGGAGAVVPIIALTADASPEDRAAALAAGMNDFMTKPISPEGLELLACRHAKV